MRHRPGRTMPFRDRRNIEGWRFAYLPVLLCAFALAADPPLVPLTVCEVLHDLASNEGKAVAVLGRYSFRENGRWMGAQVCDTGSPGLAVLPQLRWLRNFFEPVLRLPNPADKRAVFCFHHAVAAAGFQHSEKPM